MAVIRFIKKQRLLLTWIIGAPVFILLLHQYFRFKIIDIHEIDDEQAGLFLGMVIVFFAGLILFFKNRQNKYIHYAVMIINSLYWFGINAIIIISYKIGPFSINSNEFAFLFPLAVISLFFITVYLIKLSNVSLLELNIFWVALNVFLYIISMSLTILLELDNLSESPIVTSILICHIITAPLLIVRRIVFTKRNLPLHFEMAHLWFVTTTALFLVISVVFHDLTLTLSDVEIPNPVVLITCSVMLIVGIIIPIQKRVKLNLIESIIYMITNTVYGFIYYYFYIIPDKAVQTEFYSYQEKAPGWLLIGILTAVIINILLMVLFIMYKKRVLKIKEQLK